MMLSCQGRNGGQITTYKLGLQLKKMNNIVIYHESHGSMESLFFCHNVWLEQPLGMQLFLFQWLFQLWKFLIPEGLSSPWGKIDSPVTSTSVLCITCRQYTESI